MKKLILVLTILSLGVVTAQESTNTIKNQELKLNVLYALGEFPEISYEYILNEENSVGASLAIGDFEGFDDNLKFAFTPYFRWYFGKKRAAGFFAETFAMLNVAEDDYFFNSNDATGETGTGFALGVAFGGKWVTKRNWVFELYTGYGRNIINDDITQDVPRAGITLGKRF
jgi:hypothetical protein